MQTSKQEDPPLMLVLPKALTLADQNVSLEPDMIFGWAPKVEQKGIIPLTFNNVLTDQLIQYLLEREPHKVLYLGFRPLNSAQLHKQFVSPCTYYVKSCRKTTTNYNQLPFLGMNPNVESSIKFDAIFECGNLDLVVKVSEWEYDLFMRVDSNTKGHTSWYYFNVTGIPANQRIIINICNFTKARSLYERGMKPYICVNSKWQQGGDNVTFGQKQMRYPLESQKKYRCLSFELRSNDMDDIIQVAYCPPYSYSQLMSDINNLVEQYDYVKKSTLCESLSGIQVPLLTLENNTSVLQKKVFLVQARVHPGESNGSWVMKGLLDYLTSVNGQQLLDKCIIKVIPMLNPDGVIFGNYRTGCAGRDLNRRFSNTDPVLFPTVQAVKQLIKLLQQCYGDGFMGFLDLHGHSVKKNVFIYGPEYPLWSPNYYKSRILAKLLDAKTDMFRYYSCIFRIADIKRSTARGVFSELYDLANCFTMETSNGSYYHETKTYDFTPEHWKEIGNLLGNSLCELIDNLEEIDKILADRSLVLESKRTSRRQIAKTDIAKKKRSVTVHKDDKATGFKDAILNSKFQKMFMDNSIDKVNVSMSEGGSDSESSDDDYDESQLDMIRHTMVPKYQKQQIDKSTSQHISRAPVQFKQRERELTKDPSDKQLTTTTVIPKSPIKRMQYTQIIKKPVQNGNPNPYSIKQFKIVQNSNQQIEQLTDSPKIMKKYEQMDTKERDHMFEEIPVMPILSHNFIRPSTAKLDVTDEMASFNQKEHLFYKPPQFKGHQRLKSQQFVNKVEKKSFIRKAIQQTPPLLQQISITTKPTGQLNNDHLESMGIILKQKLFVHQEDKLAAEYYKSFLMGPKTITDVCRPNRSKACVPSSFYSVKKHMQNRQNVETKRKVF